MYNIKNNKITVDFIAFDGASILLNDESKVKVRNWKELLIDDFKNSINNINLQFLEFNSQINEIVNSLLQEMKNYIIELDNQLQNL